MVRIQYQLLKDNEPIALGSMVHCLDVFYWEIYYGYDHLEYDIVPFSQDEEVHRKAKVLDEVKNFTTERLKEQKLTDEYDFGERLICEEIKRIWESE